MAVAQSQTPLLGDTFTSSLFGISQQHNQIKKSLNAADHTYVVIVPYISIEQSFSRRLFHANY